MKLKRRKGVFRWIYFFRKKEFAKNPGHTGIREGKRMSVYFARMPATTTMSLLLLLLLPLALTVRKKIISFCSSAIRKYRTREKGRRRENSGKWQLRRILLLLPFLGPQREENPFMPRRHKSCFGFTAAVRSARPLLLFL